MVRLFSLLKAFGALLKIRLRDVKLFSDYLVFYFKKKIAVLVVFFEKQKDMIVHFLLMKRGRYNRPFLHITTMGVLAVGVLVAPVLADTYPLLAEKATVNRLPAPNGQEQSISADNNVFSTSISDKPRDSIIDYTVERGDTLSTIAEKFGVSTDTIKWANDMTDDSLSVGDSLKILPVSGIAHKVQPGDTIYTIAKKYGVDAQNIVNFPFNDYANPETFSLVVGQIVIVPDGVKPSAAPVAPRYYATVPQHPVVSSGGFFWPVSGLITQYPVWYHLAYDIADPIGTPIVAAKDGVVTLVTGPEWNYGYGRHIIIDNGDGISTLYAHMSATAVGTGQSVVGGKTVVGYIGMTGRTTGPHVHFEVRINGHTVSPALYLR